MPRLKCLAPRVAIADTRSAKPPPKTADPVYLTPEYRAWQAEVIRRAGGCCQDPECKTPNRRGARLFADHIKELKDGGALLDPKNGLARCGSCHSRKTARVRAERMAQRFDAAPQRAD